MGRPFSQEPLGRPFRACSGVGLFPRALPWAEINHPFRACPVRLRRIRSWKLVLSGRPERGGLKSLLLCSAESAAYIAQADGLGSRTTKKGQALKGRLLSWVGGAVFFWFSSSSTSQRNASRKEVDVSLGTR